MVAATLDIETVLGRLSISAHCPWSDETQVTLRLDVGDAPGYLPPGMSVLRRRAVILRLTATDEVPVLQWACTLLGAVTGSPCNGEGLSAQTWEGGSHVVTVGTEDDDYLMSRLTFLKPNDDSTSYSADRLELTVASIPRSPQMSLHFVVAENPWPEPVEASSWFAVDVPHVDLVRLL